MCFEIVILDTALYSDLWVFLGQMLGGYADFMYQTGMVDELQRQYVKQQTDTGVKLIQQEKWVEAFEVRLLPYHIFMVLC